MYVRQPDEILIMREIDRDAKGRKQGPPRARAPCNFSRTPVKFRGRSMRRRRR